MIFVGVCSANSEDPDEMPHRVVLRRGMYCLLRQTRYSENSFFFLIITCYASIYTMDQSDLIVCSSMDTYIGLKRVNCRHIWIYFPQLDDHT